MIGIFDSGVGGICAYRRVRELLPYEDVIYLADRKNAPYGTKDEDEIKRLTEKNIRLLTSLGAEKILIACCTASSVHRLLPEALREISIPIIRPAAELAARVGRRIAVIATRHTANTHAFSEEIKKCAPREVIEFADQELVSLVEEGNRDGRVSRRCAAYLSELGARVEETKADILILGCTHFSHLKGEIARLLPSVKIISPAHLGAEETVKKTTPRKERGKAIYTVP